MVGMAVVGEMPQAGGCPFVSFKGQKELPALSREGKGTLDSWWTRSERGRTGCQCCQ